MAENIYSVSEINNFIKDIFEDVPEFRNIQIIGEISNFKRYPSGHCYFTLKDKDSVLKAVMFKFRAVNLRFEPQNGDVVLVVGNLGVYERDGVYQLYVDLIIPQGTGNLMLEYERLKSKLEAEGLFAESRKKLLPLHPKCIGIVTSPAGAAVRDIITVARRRNPGVKLYLYPVKVQGQGAADEIAAAVKFFNKNKLADILIVGRGGGSIEELWAFNEEVAVRAVAASRIPVISAVGHETDFTLCDFAADKRAATPSQAAELAVADLQAYKEKVEYLHKKCINLMQLMINKYEYELNKLNDSWVLKTPERLLTEKMLRTDSALKNLSSAMERIINNAGHKFEVQINKLNSLSPLAVLSRGYSVVQNEDKHVVRSVEQVRWGSEVTIRVNDGKITSVVQNVERC